MKCKQSLARLSIDSDSCTVWYTVRLALSRAFTESFICSGLGENERISRIYSDENGEKVVFTVHLGVSKAFTCHFRYLDPSEDRLSKYLHLRLPAA